MIFLVEMVIKSKRDHKAAWRISYTVRKTGIGGIAPELGCGAFI